MTQGGKSSKSVVKSAASKPVAPSKSAKAGGALAGERSQGASTGGTRTAVDPVVAEGVRYDKRVSQPTRRHGEYHGQSRVRGITEKQQHDLAEIEAGLNRSESEWSIQGFVDLTEDDVAVPEVSGSGDKKKNMTGYGKVGGKLGIPRGAQIQGVKRPRPKDYAEPHSPIRDKGPPMPKPCDRDDPEHTALQLVYMDNIWEVLRFGGDEGFRTSLERLRDNASNQLLRFQFLCATRAICNWDVPSETDVLQCWGFISRRLELVRAMRASDNKSRFRILLDKDTYVSYSVCSVAFAP
jgi:hypothetical protein